MTKFYPEKINLFERKDTEDKPKDYLLGADGRLQEVFRAKNRLVLSRKALAWRKDQSRYLVCSVIIMSGIGD